MSATSPSRSSYFLPPIGYLVAARADLSALPLKEERDRKEFVRVVHTLAAAAARHSAPYTKAMKSRSKR